jgi:hypothetical protein
MNPLIITGYHQTAATDRGFAYHWYLNTTKSYTGQIFVFETAHSFFPDFLGVVKIPTNYNLGHVGDLLNKSICHEFCGWSASVLAGALLAYNCGKDMLYKESDCLAFGPWIAQMYADMGEGSFIFGAKHQSPPWMPCSQSLFLIRHSYIPTFVQRYIAMGTDASVSNLPEHKFVRLEEMDWDKVKRLSFGYDRERPINYEDKVWYGQKFTSTEMEELKNRGLI